MDSDETPYATDGASSQLGRGYPKKSRVHLRLVSLATRNGQQARRLNKTRKVYYIMTDGMFDSLF